MADGAALPNVTIAAAGQTYRGSPAPLALYMRIEGLNRPPHVGAKAGRDAVRVPFIEEQLHLPARRLDLLVKVWE